VKSAQGVGIGIGIAILIFVLILGLNVYAISNLQFRAQSIEDFSIFPDLKMNMNMETCNPTFFPASYKAIYLDVYYKQNNLGTATMYGSTIPPGANMPTKGNVDLNSGSVLGSIIDAIGSALLGSTPSTKDVKFKIKLDAPILGIIPFTIEKYYSYNEFSKMLKGGNDYGCSIQNPIPNFGAIESQFENEINSLKYALDEASKQIESVQKPLEDVKSSLESLLQESGKNLESIQERTEEIEGEKPSQLFKLPAPEPFMSELMLSDWSPELKEQLTIASYIVFCKDSSEKVQIKIFYPDGKVYADRTLPMNSDCEFQTTITLPSEKNYGVWKVTAELPSMDKRFTSFIFDSY